MGLKANEFKSIRNRYWTKGFKITYLILIFSFIGIIIVNSISNIIYISNHKKDIKESFDNYPSYVVEADNKIFLLKYYNNESEHDYYYYENYATLYRIDENIKLAYNDYGNESNFDDFYANIKHTCYYTESYSRYNDSEFHYEYNRYYGLKYKNKEIIYDLDSNYSINVSNVDIDGSDIHFTYGSEMYSGTVYKYSNCKKLSGLFYSGFGIKDPSIAVLASSFDDFFTAVGRIGLYTFIALIGIALAIAVISIMKRRIYQFVFSLHYIFFSLMLISIVSSNTAKSSSLGLTAAFKFFTQSDGTSMFMTCYFIISVIFALTFLFTINKRYPSGIIGYKEYKEKVNKLNGFDKKQFINDVEVALLTNNIEDFSNLLEMECECSNEEYKTIVESVGGAIADPSITDSRFIGSSFSYFIHIILWGLLIVVTLGIAYPFVVVMKEKYLANRTYTTGHKNLFDGNGFQLIGKYILWMLLTIITFGIYSIFLITKLIKWKVSHTHFMDTKVKESKYDGNGFVRYFLNIGLGMLAGVTLGLAYPFMVCTMQRYDKRHSVIDGYRLKFTGKAISYLGKMIIWALLTIITFGIFYIFVPVKKQKWIRSHTEIDDLYGNDLQPKEEEYIEIKQSDSNDEPKESISESSAIIDKDNAFTLDEETPEESGDEEKVEVSIEEETPIESNVHEQSNDVFALDEEETTEEQKEDNKPNNGFKTLSGLPSFESFNSFKSESSEETLDTEETNEDKENE